MVEGAKMKYFTKEYIELCKDKKVQELRPDIKCGDYCINIERSHMFLNTEDYEPGRKEYRNNLTWLPTGDQLDEEIVKICEKKTIIPKPNIDGYSISYHFDMFFDKEKKYYNAKIICFKEFDKGGLKSGALDRTIEFTDTNPLIAKILLLIQLLEQKWPK